MASRPKLQAFFAEQAVSPTRSGQPCRTCGHAKVAADVLEWCRAREQGSTVPLGRFHEGYLLRVYRRTPSFGSIRGHVLRCLKRDPVSGLPHAEPVEANPARRLPQGRKRRR